MGHLQGFATEQQDETYVYSMNIGIDMVQFMVFTIVLAVITAVIDLAITISSPMYELSETNPELNQGQLFKSGMRVGREILATSANTIYLAYFGGQLTLFFWFSNYIIHLVISSIPKFSRKNSSRYYLEASQWHSAFLLQHGLQHL